MFRSSIFRGQIIKYCRVNLEKKRRWGLTTDHFERLEQSQNAADITVSKYCFEKKTEHYLQIIKFWRPDVAEKEAAPWGDRTSYFERFEHKKGGGKH